LFSPHGPASIRLSRTFPFTKLDERGNNVARSTADPFADLRRLARRSGQRGAFTSAQASNAGVSPVQLHRLVKRGVVVCCAPRVYRFAVGAAPTWKDRLAIELLSTGGVACGLTAAALYDLVQPLTPHEVLVPRGSRHAVPGRHTPRELARFETTTVGGLRALVPIRTVLDSVHRLPPDRAVALVESAIVRKLVKPLALERRARELQHPRRPGCAVVLRILADLHPELARSRNEWEALVARRAKEYGLEPPELEYEVFIGGRRYIVDAAWSRTKVGLEFDGRDPHMRWAVHDNGSLRRNDFADADWLRFGITADALKRRDDRAFAQVARAIARRQRLGSAAIADVEIDAVPANREDQ
jgi:Transcriptional regulator, AbiEi antitoxin